MAAVSVRSNDGNPASAGGGRMVRFAGFTAEAPAVGSAAEEGAAGTVAEAAAGGEGGAAGPGGEGGGGGGGGVRRTRGAHELVLTRLDVLRACGSALRARRRSWARGDAHVNTVWLLCRMWADS